MAKSVNLDSSTRLDITCRKGDTFVLTTKVKNSSGGNYSWSGHSVKMEVRTSDTGTVVVPDAETTANTSTNGTLIITIDAANMDMDGGMYVYDVEVTDSNSKVSTWLHGLFIVNEDVTE
jgi:hypothetical protein